MADQVLIVSAGFSGAVLARELVEATDWKGVSFPGRLATYRYLDMDRVIAEALEFASSFLDSFSAGGKPPIFQNET
jgi:UDP-galactopyranose mutase